MLLEFKLTSIDGREINIIHDNANDAVSITVSKKDSINSIVLVAKELETIANIVALHKRNMQIF